jgi:hypothetical protein
VLVERRCEPLLVSDTHDVPFRTTDSDLFPYVILKDLR